ncbi:MAG: hypothetical protein V1913_08065 [Fibrobacterota bacterium]
MITSISDYTVSPASVAGLSTKSTTSQKLELALALSSVNKSVNLGILGSLPQNSGTGISASLLSRIYDNKAITTAVLESYRKKMEEATAQDEQAVANEADAIGTTSTDEAEKPVTPVVETTPAAAPPAYKTTMANGRGYDADAVRKFYDEMTAWYADPANAGKDYTPATTGNTVDVTA